MFLRGRADEIGKDEVICSIIAPRQINTVIPSSRLWRDEGICQITALSSLPLTNQQITFPAFGGVRKERRCSGGRQRPATSGNCSLFTVNY